jgi:predicted Zn-dependent protease
MSIIERLEATLAAGNDSATLRFGLASAYFAAQQFDEARRHAGVAVALDPDYSAAWRVLGRACAAMGETGTARDAFGRGIAAAERRGDAQLVREMRVFLRRLSPDEE